MIRTRRPTPADVPRVTLVGRSGCHLCDDARVVIAEVTRDLGEEFAELSIDDDAALREKYAEMIPVTLVDGRMHDYFRVDPRRLRRALSGRGRA